MQYPTKEGFLESIQPDMKLNRDFFLKIYGYEISFPGFAEVVLSKLEQAGCSKDREYYERFVSEYEEERKASVKKVAADYQKQLQNKRKDDTRMKNRNDEGVPAWKFQQMSEQELTKLYQRLKAERIIENPEQFATMVQRGL